MRRHLKTESRPISNAGNRKVIGQTPSRKRGAMVPWESSLERDFIYLCEYEPTITSIESQPEKIRIWIDGVAHIYHADYRIYFDDGEMRVVEVKPDSKLADPEMRARLHAAGLYYAERGIDYQVVRESDLRTTYKIPNIRRLYRYARLQPTRQETAVLDAVGAKVGTGTLADFGNALELAGVSRQILYHAMFHQRVAFDIESALIGLMTPVTWRPA